MPTARTQGTAGLRAKDGGGAADRDPARPVQGPGRRKRWCLPREFTPEGFGNPKHTGQIAVYSLVVLQMSSQMVAAMTSYCWPAAVLRGSKTRLPNEVRTTHSVCIRHAASLNAELRRTFC